MHHPLRILLIGLSNGLHRPLLINGYTHQFVVWQAGELTQALLQVDGKPFMVRVGFLLIPCGSWIQNGSLARYPEIPSAWCRTNPQISDEQGVKYGTHPMEHGD
jgi:hypothetical protein